MQPQKGMRVHDFYNAGHKVVKHIAFNRTTVANNKKKVNVLMAFSKTHARRNVAVRGTRTKQNSILPTSSHKKQGLFRSI